jgi:hypothetical protein
VLIQSAAGRFEVAAADATLAHGVAAAAEDAWRLLSPVLALPEGFSTPVYVRLVSGAAEGSEPFRVIVDVGGIVSLRVRTETLTPIIAQRALVQALLMRLAVAQHGVTEWLTAPLWLEHACVALWTTRASAAQLDALKHEAISATPPSMDEILEWKRGAGEPRALAQASFWLLTFFQPEPGRAREWPELLRRLLKGDDPLIAVAMTHPGRYGSAEDRDLWWKTGYHAACRARTLPALEAADSRHELGALARFVFAGPGEENDVVVPLAGVVSRANEPLVTAELNRRAASLGRLIPLLHPFYRNAGLSLGEAFASRSLTLAKRANACATFEQDWRDALELETSTRSALDRLEAAMPRE